MLSEVFYTFFITSVIAFLLAIGRMLYKSKCREFSFCCFKIVRDVGLEAEIDEEMIENGIDPANSTKQLKPLRNIVTNRNDESKDTAGRQV